MDDKSRSSCDTIDFSTYTTPGLLIQDNVTFLKRLRCDIAVINSGPWNWQTSSGNIDGWDLFSRELIYFVWMMYIIYSLSSQRVLFVPGAGSDLRRQIDYWKKRQKAPMSSSAVFFFLFFLSEKWNADFVVIETSLSLKLNTEHPVNRTVI